MVDDSLEESKDVYFEAADHESLIHVSGADFHQLMATVPHRHLVH
jgi:Ala-tRNA(Pro) deacylase